jgi:GntR family transcriptional repressor for pyruvate dehydrogenase complex
VSTRTTSEAPPLSTAAALEPLEVPTAYEAVVDRLRRAIHLGTFAPGERLPPERELAARLGVARMTLREALRVLQAEGYLITRHGAHGGPQIAGPPEQLRSTLRQRLPEIEELVAFRRVVEAGAARLAAQNATSGDIDALAATIAELSAATDTPTFRRADARFHLLLARTAGNTLLERAIEDARERMFGATDALPFTLMVHKTADEHARILAAVRQGKSDAAARRMAAHLDSTLQQLRHELR